MSALNANLTVLAGKLHYVTFGVITRNITRLSKTRISHWFIRVFDKPGFLLIRRQVIELQLEEPPKKAWSQAMFFPFIRNQLSRWGPLGDFLPSNLIELLHLHYTVKGIGQELVNLTVHALWQATRWIFHIILLLCIKSWHESRFLYERVKIRLDMHHGGVFRFFSRIFKERPLADIIRRVFIFFFFLLHLGLKWRDGAIHFRDIQSEPRPKGLDAVSPDSRWCANALPFGVAVAIHWP